MVFVQFKRSFKTTKKTMITSQNVWTVDAPFS